MTKEQYEAKKAALIEEIQRVFDGVEREDGVTLHEAAAIDDYGHGSDEERAEARLKDTETRWQEVPDEAIRTADANLCFFDAKGFHYYFPAYLAWDLRFADCKDENFWSNTFDSIAFRLLAHEGDEVDDFFLEKFSLFTPQEKRTIAYYLQFKIERADFITEHEGWEMDYERKKCQWALDVYWGQFL